MGIQQSDLSIWDPKVCKPFIAGICPHELFTNTVRSLWRTQERAAADRWCRRRKWTWDHARGLTPSR